MPVLPSLNSIRVGINILMNGEPYTVQTASLRAHATAKTRHTKQR